MRYRNILRAFLSTPLAILPEKLEEIRSFLLAKAAGEDIPQETVDRLAAEREHRYDSILAAVQAAEPQAARRNDGVILAGRIAVMPIFGVIAQRVGFLERASGGVSTEEIGASLDSLVNDKAVKAIVMAYDSPGGSVFGVPELATKIRSLRDQKKIVAMADSIAASAAYWLAAQAGEVWVTPGGQVGSVGVIAAHEDLSGALEQAGIKVTTITSSPHKAEFSPDHPLSEEARAELQAKVDAYHAMFVADLARGRGVSESKVNSDFGGGRMLTARASVEAGMADRVGTLEQLLRKLDPSGGASAEGEPVEPRQPVHPGMAAARARAVEVSG